MRPTDYEELINQAKALIQGVPHLIANLANLSALLYQTLDEVNWAGFYLIKGEKLVLGPFQGKTACIEIPVGKGVCGAAARDDAAVLVPDVHMFAGHIACDADSKSEIVVPLHTGGRLAGVLDIDSPRLARFTEADKLGLEALVRMAEAEFDSARAE